MAGKKMLVVCGPTASGKTDFAVNMAKILNGEIISADCMLIYQGLNIGTAKPSPAEMKGVAHYMIDVAPPSSSYSVSDYEAAALPLSEKILDEGKVPIVCGGTGFYIQALLFKRTLGSVGSDESIRKKYEDVEKERGRDYLHSLLKAADPSSAEKIHKNDVKRVIRALEIYELTGKRKSEQQDGFVPRFPYVAVAFDYPRERLYARIDRRVEKMLTNGLVDEVKALTERGIGAVCQSMQGIGYKEVLYYLKGDISYSTMTDIIKQNTRNYAKRQITFFKKLPGIVWLDPNDSHNEEKTAELLC